GVVLAERSAAAGWKWRRSGRCEATGFCRIARSWATRVGFSREDWSTATSAALTATAPDAGATFGVVVLDVLLDEDDEPPPPEPPLVPPEDVGVGLGALPGSGEGTVHVSGGGNGQGVGLELVPTSATAG